MSGQKKLPHLCPSCDTPLKVTALACPACETVVSGSFDLPAMTKLSPEELQFVFDFVKCSGSLKVMAQQLGLSYPTVRNLLDDLIARLKSIDA